jgi:hypothetical protein
MRDGSALMVRQRAGGACADRECGCSHQLLQRLSSRLVVLSLGDAAGHRSRTTSGDCHHPRASKWLILRARASAIDGANRLFIRKFS